ncbi:unnamed protein product [Mycena citricolor]|uniref:RanBD1 domain-containing protein n=1 Tax=Mycena citricolor TaxID=2018698 RepID=A0AAD2HCH2_9AGAR|nr:unnamed protein product [Mycena citricolor]CAK5273673.1 unnamed protein product [Mycena citricolor]
MLPVTVVESLPIVFCGLATLAATAGYTAARKIRSLPTRAMSSPNPASSQEKAEPSTSSGTSATSINSPEKAAMPPADEITDLATPEDVESPSAPIPDLESVVLKRKRSPEDEEDEIDPEMGYPHNLKAIYPNKRRNNSEPPQEESEQVGIPAETRPVDKSLVPAVVENISEAAQPTSSLEVLVSPQTPAKSSDCPGPRFAFPQTPPRFPSFPTTRNASTGAFAGFAAATSATFGSSNAALSKPSWIKDKSSDSQKEEAPALLAAKAGVLQVQSHSTGEEDEDVVLEAKGVKLFVKQGDDAFSSGMVGHIKFLSHRATGIKRLLFRREPLWKVSMNVLMQPTVRCTFDAHDLVLRVAMKEATGQTAVYAFKPGRACKRNDFQDFAESLVAQARQTEQN